MEILNLLFCRLSTTILWENPSLIMEILGFSFGSASGIICFTNWLVHKTSLSKSISLRVLENSLKRCLTDRNILFKSCPFFTFFTLCFSLMRNYMALVFLSSFNQMSSLYSLSEYYKWNLLVSNIVYYYYIYCCCCCFFLRKRWWKRQPKSFRDKNFCYILKWQSLVTNRISILIKKVNNVINGETSALNLLENKLIVATQTHSYFNIKYTSCMWTA